MNHRLKTHTICYGYWKTSLRGSKQEGHFATTLMTTKEELFGTHSTILCHHWMFIELLPFFFPSFLSVVVLFHAGSRFEEGKVHRDDRFSVCEWEQTMFAATRGMRGWFALKSVSPRTINVDIHCRVPTANTMHQHTEKKNELNVISNL